MSVIRTMSITSFPRVIPPYRCDEMDATSMRRIEKQMCAHPHIRLGHGSKVTAHVRIDTSYINLFKEFRRNEYDSYRNFMRKPPHIFDTLLALVTPVIQR